MVAILKTPRDRFMHRREEFKRTLGMRDAEVDAIIANAVGTLSEYQDGDVPPMPALLSALLSVALMGRAAEIPTDKYRELIFNLVPQMWDLAGDLMIHRGNELDELAKQGGTTVDVDAPH